MTKTSIIRPLIADEHQAIRDYGEAAKKLKGNAAARLMKHIQSEEREHARELQGSIRNIGKAA